MVSEPHVSVIMPVRDCAAFLQEAVDSVLGQTFGDFELIAIDDHSRDASADILARAADHDPRIIVTANAGDGLVDALNHGLALARAPLIARMDADDISHRDRFARQVERLDSDPDLVLLGCSFLLIAEDGAPLGEFHTPVRHETLVDRVFTSPPFGHPCIMVRTRAMRAIGGYRSLFAGAEDHDLYLRLLDTGRFGSIPELLVSYRRHPGQITSRAYHQGLLASVAAIHSAQVRQAGRADPADQPGSTVLGLSVDFLKAAVRDARRLDSQRLLPLEMALRALSGLDHRKSATMFRRLVLWRLLTAGRLRLANRFRRRSRAALRSSGACG